MMQFYVNGPGMQFFVWLFIVLKFCFQANADE